jgi:hypothetical protein
MWEGEGDTGVIANIHANNWAKIPFFFFFNFPLSSSKTDSNYKINIMFGMKHANL